MKRFDQLNAGLASDYLEEMMAPESVQLADAKQTTQQLLDELLGHHEEDILTSHFLTPEFSFDSEE